jgi:hypothetical protein
VERANAVKSIYDLITLILFAGLAILYLQRSIEQARDRTIHYLPPAIGCAAANWLGDHDQPLLAGLVIIAGLVYTWYVLKPFQQKL